MAIKTSPSLLLCLFALALLLFSQVAAAARRAPAKKEETAAAAAVGAARPGDKKDKDCLTQEGTVLIPGIGRYKIGTYRRPTLRGLDHSGPAAAHAQFLPGRDDTFVPNPGHEVPNPFRRVIP